MSDLDLQAVASPVSRTVKPKRFGTILADPPWRFRNWSMEEQAKLGEKWGRANGRPIYNLLDTAMICALPISQVAEQDATLLLWATNPMMPDAMQVLEAWGFEFKTMLTWAKMTAAAAPRIGLGYHARSATEHLLIGTRGCPKAPEVQRRPTSLFFCPIGAHSAKPDYQYEIAEGYTGPYLELFHRPRNGMFPPREGWTFLGNEVDGKDIRDALQELILIKLDEKGECKNGRTRNREKAIPGTGREAHQQDTRGAAR